MMDGRRRFRAHHCAARHRIWFIFYLPTSNQYEPHLGGQSYLPTPTPAQVSRARKLPTYHPNHHLFPPTAASCFGVFEAHERTVPAGRRQQSVGVRWDGAARLRGRLREARPHGEAAARLSEALVAHMDATNPQTLGQEAKPLETSPPGLRPTYLPTVVPGPASSKATYLPQEVRTD